MCPNINPSSILTDTEFDKSSLADQLASLVQPVSDDHSHRNQKLRQQFSPPKREEKRIMMKLRNHSDPTVVRNVGTILAFTIGVSTYTLAKQHQLSEKQVRRLIVRWNQFGLAALPDAELLPEPAWTKEQLIAEWETIQTRYNEKLAAVMELSGDQMEFLRFEEETLKLRNQMWDEMHCANVKQIIEDPALKDYAVQQAAKLYPSGWLIHDRKRRKTIKRLRREMEKAGKKRKAKLQQRIEKQEKQLINKLDLWQLDLKDSIADVEITLATGGSVRVTTPYYLLVRRGRGRPRKSRGSGDEGNGIYPVLDLIGFGDRKSLLFCSIVARHAAQHPSYKEASRWLEQMNIRLSPTQVKAITDRLAEDAVDATELWLTTGIPPPGSPDETAEGADIAIMGDGGRLKVRTDHCGKKKANGYRDFESDWRQPLEGCVFEFETTGEGDSRKVRKKADGELQEFACGTMYSYSHLFELLKAHLIRIECWKANRIAIGGDGDPDLWDKVLLPLVEALGIADKVEFFVDYYHATEHIGHFSRWKNWDEESRSSWNEQMKRVLLKQGGAAVLNEMRQQLKGPRDTNARAEMLKEAHYFAERLDKMRYPELRAMGLPIGTGSMESLIKRTNNRRLKGNAVHWKEECAHGMLHLVCMAVTDRWEEMIWNVGSLRSMRVVPPIWEKQLSPNWSSSESCTEVAA